MCGGGIFRVLMGRAGHITVVRQQGHQRFNTSRRESGRRGLAVGVRHRHQLARRRRRAYAAATGLRRRHRFILIIVVVVVVLSFVPGLFNDKAALWILIPILILLFLLGYIELCVVELLLVVRVLVVTAGGSPTEVDLSHVLLDEVTVDGLHVARRPRALVNGAHNFSLDKEERGFC